MEELSYAGGFLVGAAASSGLSCSLKLLDSSDRLPGDESYYSMLGTGLSGGLGGYEPLNAFLIGAAVGAKGGEIASEKLEGLNYGSEHASLEEFYTENDLEELWDDIEDSTKNY